MSRTARFDLDEQIARFWFCRFHPDPSRGAPHPLDAQMMRALDRIAPQRFQFYTLRQNGPVFIEDRRGRTIIRLNGVGGFNWNGINQYR